MKTLFNAKIEINNIDESKYDMLIDLLEDKNISYNITDFEEFTIDERSEDEKYQDWLDEQADMIYEERKINNE